MSIIEHTYCLRELEEVKSERDALKAHSERQAKVIFDTLAAVEDGDVDAVPWDEVRELYNETPADSLARLKAECWKEAYLAGMERGHHLTVEGGYTPDDEEAAEDYVADRQAEEGGET